MMVALRLMNNKNISENYWC